MKNIDDEEDDMKSTKSIKFDTSHRDVFVYNSGENNFRDFKKKASRRKKSTKISQEEL